MPQLALQIVDLGAFLGLALAALVIATVVGGLVLWLRARGGDGEPDPSYYVGL